MRRAAAYLGQSSRPGASATARPRKRVAHIDLVRGLRDLAEVALTEGCEQRNRLQLVLVRVGPSLVLGVGCGDRRRFGVRAWGQPRDLLGDVLGVVLDPA